MDARLRKAMNLLRSALHFTRHHPYCEWVHRDLCDCGAARTDAAILRFLHPDPPYPEAEQPV
jgi:hypothetical protein